MMHVIHQAALETESTLLIYDEIESTFLKKDLNGYEQFNHFITIYVNILTMHTRGDINHVHSWGNIINNYKA